jgi:hypothetical protein
VLPNDVRSAANASIECGRGAAATKEIRVRQQQRPVRPFDRIARMGIVGHTTRRGPMAGNRYRPGVRTGMAAITSAKAALKRAGASNITK